MGACAHQLDADRHNNVSHRGTYFRVRRGVCLRVRQFLELACLVSIR
jgi:hypothetical protein